MLEGLVDVFIQYQSIFLIFKPKSSILNTMKEIEPGANRIYVFFLNLIYYLYIGIRPVVFAIVYAMVTGRMEIGNMENG